MGVHCGNENGRATWGTRESGRTDSHLNAPLPEVPTHDQPSVLLFLLLNYWRKKTRMCSFSPSPPLSLVDCFLIQVLSYFIWTSATVHYGPSVPLRLALLAAAGVASLSCKPDLPTCLVTPFLGAPLTRRANLGLLTWHLGTSIPASPSLLQSWGPPRPSFLRPCKASSRKFSPLATTFKPTPTPAYSGQSPIALHISDIALGTGIHISHAHVCVPLMCELLEGGAHFCTPHARDRMSTLIL